MNGFSCKKTDLSGMYNEKKGSHLGVFLKRVLCSTGVTTKQFGCKKSLFFHRQTVVTLVSEFAQNHRY